MGKSVPPDDYNNLMMLLTQVNEKISQARVLNGGFDRLEKQVEDIKQMQQKFNADFENHVMNDERIESKIDRLYDPEEGIYAKVNKTEVMMTQLTENMNRLSDADAKFSTKLERVDETGRTVALKLEALQKITGEDNKDLSKAVKTSKGFWKFALWAGAGIITAVGKMLWDLFVG